jgi:hypothetical protein
MRRAYGVLRQGVERATVSRGGPARWRGRVPGRPSPRSPRIVSPRIERPRAPKGLWFTIPEAEMHELISNRGASTKIWTARRARKAEVSGDESAREPCGGSRGGNLLHTRENPLRKVATARCAFAGAGTERSTSAQSWRANGDPPHRTLAVSSRTGTCTVGISSRPFTPNWSAARRVRLA